MSEVLFYTVHRAQGVGDKPAPPPRSIVIGAALPERDPNGRDLMQEDADLIADVLIGTLPGGTIDRLLAALLIRRGTMLRVPHPGRPDQRSRQAWL